jgi:hypothetical protein
VTTRYVETEQERTQLLRYLEQQKLPLVVSMERGSHRTVKQNRLQRQWLNEIAEQLGDRTAEEARGYCKLAFGVPILRAENEAFLAAYDKHVKGLPYETKLAMMMEPLDFPVTRLMTTRQHTNYLDAIHRHFSEQGLALTDPGDLLNKADARDLEAA